MIVNHNHLFEDLVELLLIDSLSTYTNNENDSNDDTETFPQHSKVFFSLKNKIINEYFKRLY